jgi:hypothetical protein
VGGSQFWDAPSDIPNGAHRPSPYARATHRRARLPDHIGGADRAAARTAAAAAAAHKSLYAMGDTISNHRFVIQNPQRKKTRNNNHPFHSPSLPPSIGPWDYHNNNNNNDNDSAGDEKKRVCVAPPGWEKGAEKRNFGLYARGMAPEQADLGRPKGR